MNTPVPRLLLAAMAQHKPNPTPLRTPRAYRRRLLTHSLMAGALALAALAQSASARLYDNFNSSANWTLANNSGSATIGSSVLTLTAPASVLCTPSATLNAAQGLSGTRQSILVRSHSGVSHSTVFFFWATASSGNQLEIKLDDVNPTSVVAGYYSGGTYHWVASTAYSPGSDGLYLAFYESGGTTHWQTSTDGSTWTDIGSLADPISTSSVTFEVQHKAYVATASATSTVVDCFNYKATGVGYHSLEDKTYTGSDGWQLYTEGFHNGKVCTYCSAIVVNGVDSSQHFTDSTIPSPNNNQQGYHNEIVSTDAPTTDNYYNTYRYQDLAYVDADSWTYHLYFKYAYPQYSPQGLEFPINKYTGSQRLQGAVAWYPQGNGTTGTWSVWTGTAWQSTGYQQTFNTNWWYEVTFTVGLHDGNVYYSGFKAGSVGSLTSWSWNNSYAGTSSTHPQNTVPAMQIDDNIKDTTVANTRKDVYMAEWNIDWTDQRLP